MNLEEERPTWDEYFLMLAKLAATRSTCLAFPVGAVIAKQASFSNGLQRFAVRFGTLHGSRLLLSRFEQLRCQQNFAIAGGPC